MIPGYSVVGVVFALALVAVSFYLLRRGRLSGSSFVLWLFVAAALGVVSAAPMVLDVIFAALGTQIMLSSVTLVAFVTLLSLILYLNVKSDDLESKMSKMAAQIAAGQYHPEPEEKGAASPDGEHT